MNRFQKFALILIILISFILRFYKLGASPPGLYWDEAVFGYDAYSILKTGSDHHGNFLPLFFESFGDWKLPLYHYLLVPSIAIFGLGEFAIRFPSALLGSLSVVLLFLFIKKLTGHNNLALLSALFLAISPWHIQFSRAGFESTAGLFFLMGGIYLFLLFIEKPQKITLTFAFLLLTLSMYSYHAYRIFTPLLAIALVFIYFPEIKKKAKTVLVCAILPALLLIPLLVFTFSPQGRTRAISQTAFIEEEFRVAKLDYDQKSKKPLRFTSKYFYQKPIYDGYIALKNYLDHFSPTYLFIRGDQIGRHSQVDMGQTYIFEGLLLVLAPFALGVLTRESKKLMLAWLLLSPLPAVIVQPTPHAYRALQMAPALAAFSALGAYFLFRKSRLALVNLLILLTVAYWFVSYLHLLFVHYPKKFGADWQDGYRQMVATIQKYQQNYDKVYVTNVNNVPYIYLLFYQKYGPQKFIDQKGSQQAFDKYVFVARDFDPHNRGKVLYVAPHWEKVDGTLLAASSDSFGRPLYSFWEVGGQN